SARQEAEKAMVTASAGTANPSAITAASPHASRPDLIERFIALAPIHKRCAQPARPDRTRSRSRSRNGRDKGLSSRSDAGTWTRRDAGGHRRWVAVDSRLDTRRREDVVR